MVSNNISIALVWIKVIQWCGNKRRVVLKVPGEELDWRSELMEKLLAWMGHGSLLGGGRKIEFPPELCQLKEHRFRFEVHRSNEVCNILNDAVGDIFEYLSWFN